jgi:hypothetical protein
VIENMAGATTLEFRFEATQALLDLGKLTVEVWANAARLPAEIFETAGKHTYSQPISPAPTPCEIRIRLSHTFPEPPDADRDLGIIVRLPPDTIIDANCGLRLST